MKLFFYKLFLFQFFYLLCIHLPLSFSATLYVGDGTYSSIQSAVDDASDGDEIVVKAGEYKENIEVRKSVTIRSESGYTKTTVIAKDYSEDIFSIHSDQVRIEGFTLYGCYNSYPWSFSTASICLSGENANCTIVNNRCGIDENHRSDIGIQIISSSNNTIMNNLCFSNKESGIDIYNSRNNNIKNNQLVGSTYGIDLNNYSHDNTINNNLFISNLDAGIIISHSNNNGITQNKLTNNGYGIYLKMNSNNNVIYLNSFIDDQEGSIKSNSFQQNTWHSPTPIIYSYRGNLFKQYLGNYYINFDLSGNNENGISEYPYNYPYSEPLDEYPLLMPYDHYIIQPDATPQNFPPIIHTVQPNIGSIQGSYEITLSGYDFGEQQGDGKVSFDDVQAVILEWSNTKITCIAPAHAPDYVSISVITNQKKSGTKKNAFLYYDQLIYVGTGDAIKSIQEAIHASGNGLTIVVRNGKYIENVFVNKSLVIKSENGAQSTTIIAKNHRMNAVEIVGDETVLQGFTIYGAIENSAGINVMANNCKLLSNVCGTSQDKMNFVGIRLYKSENGALISQFKHVIAGNQCSYNTEDGIYANSVEHSIFENNILSYNNDHGLSGYKIINNIIQNNQLYSNNTDGIYIESSDSNILYNNQSIQNNSCGIYLYRSNDNNITSNTLQSNLQFGIQLDYDSNNNLIYHNSLIANNKNIKLLENINNKWFSQIPLYYEFKGKSYKSKVGNYFSDHDLADTDQNGITDDFYILHSTIEMDQYPLSMQSENYNIQTWSTSNKNLVENQLIIADTVTINSDRYYKWISNKTLETDLVFDQSNPVSGQISLTSPPIQNTFFKINFGISTDGIDFSPYGQLEIDATGKGSQIPFLCQLDAFTIPKDNYFAIAIHNKSATNYEIKTGLFNTFFSKPAFRNVPDIMQIEPQEGPTTGNTSISIIGSGFGNQQENQTIMFGDIESSAYETWSSTQIICKTPAHISGKFDVWVNKNDQTSPLGMTRPFIFKDSSSLIIQSTPDLPVSNKNYQISIDSTAAWIEYQINDQNWQRYNEPFEIMIEGEHTVYARAKDIDDQWVNATPLTFIIDKTPPEPPDNMISDPIEGECGSTLNIHWNEASDQQTSIAGYSILFDTQKDSTPDLVIDITELMFSTDLMTPGNDYYFHISAVDQGGNISQPLHMGPFCVNQGYTIQASAGLNGRIIPEGKFTVQQGADQSFQFLPDMGFTIDQVIIDNNLSTINDQGYTFYNINDHHTIEVTFQYNGQKPPEQVSVMNQTNGVIIQWNDKTITNEVSSYRIYRSPFFNGPFIEIDPIYINKVFVDGNPFYRVFDSFDATEILRKESYFYGISAIMPDGNITKISEPVEGIPTLTESGRIRLIPIQQELETIPGKNVMFNIYVVAVGNFQEWVELSVSYPDSQYIPDNVSYTFSETKVKPLALVKLEVNIGVEAIPETFDIDLHGSGGDRSDTIRLRCSVVQADENSSFISTHIKQKKVRLDEQIDLNGHISIRKNDSIDIFGTIIPRGTYPVEILIQTDQLIPEKLSVDSNSEGKFETSYRPDHVGHHTIKAQYKNSHDEMTKSQPIIISVRKSNKSKILCDTGVQSIETGKTIKLYSHLIPRLENIPIHFQITKPDNSVNTSQFKTDDQGEVFFNITLSQTGIWKILAWWEGNQSYEGKFSTPLYLYPGIETPRALIIAGGGNQNNTLSVSTQYLAERFYKLLINRRLNNDLIYYVSSVSEELNGRLDENLPTEQKISDFIKSLYNEGPPYQVNDDIPLLIYMVDHGGRNLFQIDTDEYLRANFLDQQLDILQEKTRCEVQMIIESCYSGSFLDDLAQSGSQKRIIITDKSTSIYIFFLIPSVTQTLSLL